jgi:hypothetical protein
LFLQFYSQSSNFLIQIGYYLIFLAELGLNLLLVVCEGQFVVSDVVLDLIEISVHDAVILVERDVKFCIIFRLKFLLQLAYLIHESGVELQVAI